MGSEMCIRDSPYTVLHGGWLPCNITTLDGGPVDPSHHDPGNLHLFSSNVPAWMMCGLWEMSSLNGSEEGRTGSVEEMIDAIRRPEGSSESSRIASIICLNAFLR